MEPADALLSARHSEPPGVSRATDLFGGVPVPPALAPLVVEAAKKYGVPPPFLAWLLQRESNFNPRAIGIPTKYGRAMGLAQFMPGTARERKVDPFDPASAIPGAASYLAELAGKHGSWERGLARYGTFSTGQGPEADAKVRDGFRRFAASGQYDPPSGRGGRPSLSLPVRVPSAPAPEPVDPAELAELLGLSDPAEELWSAYSDVESDNLMRILGARRAT